MSKLTLSIDEAVVARAKRYAKRSGKSVSKLVESYLDMVSEPLGNTQDPPILRSLRGSLRGGEPRDYRRRLVEKYR
jgi:hypothetical protein